MPPRKAATAIRGRKVMAVPRSGWRAMRTNGTPTINRMASILEEVRVAERCRLR
jgi:hypothetical protein